MERKEMLRRVQLAIVGLIFLLFMLGIFLSITKYSPYLLIPLIAANIVLLFINRTKGLFSNIVLLTLSFLLFVFLIEYISSIIGTIVSAVHGLRIALWYFRKEKKSKKKRKN